MTFSGGPGIYALGMKKPTGILSRQKKCFCGKAYASLDRSSLFSVLRDAASDFSFIAVDEFPQNWSGVKGGTSVRCQDPEDSRLIGHNFRLLNIILSRTPGLESHITQAPEHSSHQSGLAAQAAASHKYCGPVAPYGITDFSKLF